MNPAAAQRDAEADAPLQADTPTVTAFGNRFVAPAQWSLHREGSAIFMQTPEGERIALVDVHAKNADDAVNRAWNLYKPGTPQRLRLATDRPPTDGWTGIRYYTYEAPTNAHRLIAARAFAVGDNWTVAVGDISLALADKRSGQFALIFDKLLPRNYERESFMGRKAHALSPDRVAALREFIVHAQRQLEIPGIAIGLIQDGRIVLQAGFGQREQGKPAPIDSKTLFLIASNTKPLTTLMLAKLVDEGKFDWNTPVTRVLPAFRLGDAETTRHVLIKHLVCACTGLPRQDLEWLMQFAGVMPKDAMNVLARMQPTSAFGALYQYSNPLAAAGGYVGAHAAYPEAELGEAYDRTMRTRVFSPLRMRSTTFDFKRALRGNYAAPHAPNATSATAVVDMNINRSIVPVRPAGGAWSNVEDLLKYVRMELAKGQLPGGRRYIFEAALLARREQQVAMGASSYGMGLIVDRTWGTPVVHHGGSMIGYKTDVMWLPEHRVGAVILTNSDNGLFLLEPFQRRLIEILFDGKAEAEAAVEAAAERLRADRVAERKRITIPARSTKALANRYHHADLGDILVRHEGPATVFDFGEWRSEVGSLHDGDEHVAFVTIGAGVMGAVSMTFTLDPASRALILRAGQHEYRFDAVHESGASLKAIGEQTRGKTLRRPCARLHAE